MKFPKALSFIQEVLIIFLLILTFNNLLGRFDEVIVSDGVGYYDYNPSFFIFDDLNRYQFDTSSNSEVFPEFEILEAISILIIMENH